MPVESVYARVNDIQQMAGTLGPAAAPAPVMPEAFRVALAQSLNVGPAPAAATTALPLTAAPAAPATAHEDGCCCCRGDGATAPATTPSFTPLDLANAAPGTAGPQALAIAASQLGQAEDPPGSNDGPALGTYRSAVAGSMAGAPWCAYFVSWASAQAGQPVGDEGQGLGSVEQITDWARRTGRLLPTGAQPQPGDIILFGGRHVGFVESVNPDGSLTTVEGNYRNAVSRVNRSPAEATGYVRL